MINLYEVLEAANGQLVGQPGAQIFDGFCTDVTQATGSQLYVMRRTDTAEDIKRVVEQGASGIITEQPPSLTLDGVSVILVRDVVEALLAWSRYVLGKLGTKVIAVAGSAGKTVAADAIAQVLGTRYRVYVRPFANNGRLSLPLSLADIRPDDQFVVLKLGVQGVGDMAAMVQATQPETAVITNIGAAYVDGFPDIAQYTAEMQQLMNSLSPSSLAVLNYDDDAVRSLAMETRATVNTISTMNYGADMIAFNAVSTASGIQYDLRYGHERYPNQSLKILGEYHLYSIMAALCVGLRYDVPLADALQVTQHLDPLPGRMKSLQLNSGALLVDDSYGANPASTSSVLSWLKSIRENGRRTFFVFGDMDNLGENHAAAHRLIGRQAAEVADVLVTRGTGAAIAARAALDNGMAATKVHVTYTTADVVSTLKNGYSLGEGDVVVVKGGSYARLHDIVSLLQAGDDPMAAASPVQSMSNLQVIQPTHLTWVEIDHEALASNVRAIKSHVGQTVQVMAVVKADGYGHGAEMTARTALNNGASALGVSSMYEAMHLRDCGIEAPILTMNYTPPTHVRDAIAQGIDLTLYDMEVAQAYDRLAREVGKPVQVHLKIDTGMGRLGLLPDQALTLFRHLLNMRYIEVNGIYTHFSTADSDPEYMQHQLKRFRDVVKPLQATTGFRFKLVHAANSAAMLRSADTHLDMVRPGNAIYGLHPSDEVQLPEIFKPVLTWKSIVAQVKTLPAGHPVGYGNTYVTEGEETIAIVPVGYADGLRRAPANWGEVLIHGIRAPIIGRVSMEKIAVQVSHIAGVHIDDEVVLLGQQGNQRITAEQIAARLGTINYEVTTNVQSRIPRR